MTTKNSLLFGLVSAIYAFLLAFFVHFFLKFQTEQAYLPAFVLVSITLGFNHLLCKSMISEDRYIFIKLFFVALFVKMVTLIAFVVWFVMHRLDQKYFIYLLALYLGLTILLTINLTKNSDKT